MIAETLEEAIAREREVLSGLRGQADYTLEADILHLGGKIKRSPLNFLLPLCDLLFGTIRTALNDEEAEAIAKKEAALGRRKNSTNGG